MAKVAKQDAVWHTTEAADIEQMLNAISPEVLAAWKQQRADYAAYKAAKEAFEGIMERTAGVPQGKRMIFGYNFGKLSVAVVDDDRAAAKPKTAKMSLAEYLEQQGRR